MYTTLCFICCIRDFLKIDIRKKIIRNVAHYSSTCWCQTHKPTNNVSFNDQQVYIGRWLRRKGEEKESYGASLPSFVFQIGGDLSLDCTLKTNRRGPKSSKGWIQGQVATHQVSHLFSDSQRLFLKSHWKTSDKTHRIDSNYQQLNSEVVTSTEGRRREMFNVVANVHYNLLILLSWFKSYLIIL